MAAGYLVDKLRYIIYSRLAIKVNIYEAVALKVNPKVIIAEITNCKLQTTSQWMVLKIHGRQASTEGQSQCTAGLLSSCLLLDAVPLHLQGQAAVPHQVRGVCLPGHGAPLHLAPSARGMARMEENINIHPTCPLPGRAGSCP